MNPVPDASSSLEDWLQYLEQLHSSEIELGLERVLIVYRRLAASRPRSRVITVAGTNGKGSAVHAIEQLLIGSDRRTGAYSSPHIQRFNERIRINGEEVPDQVITAAFAKVEEARKSVPLTYFEFATLGAFCVFQEADPDFIVLEVGLGGRLDAVNCIDPDLAIITSIDLDHTQWLGEDRDLIGYEKAGILRPDIPAIFGDTDPPDSVLQQARAQNVDLRVLGRDFGMEDGNAARHIVLDGPNGAWTLETRHNLTTDRLVALQALLDLGVGVDAATLERAARIAPLPGRFERLPGKPEVVLDVGHNPHAARWLAQRLADEAGARRVLAVYASLRDKDSAGVVEALVDRVDEWFLAGLSDPRGQSAEALHEAVGDRLEGRMSGLHETIAEALKAALTGAAEDDIVLVFGSFYAVGEARSFMACRQEAG